MYFSSGAISHTAAQCSMSAARRAVPLLVSHPCNGHVVLLRLGNDAQRHLVRDRAYKKYQQVWCTYLLLKGAVLLRKNLGLAAVLAANALVLARIHSFPPTMTTLIFITFLS